MNAGLNTNSTAYWLWVDYFTFFTQFLPLQKRGNHDNT